MGKNYDVLIVGSGVAGCLCAYSLSNLGYDVIIIEKKEHPRNKSCGGAISQNAIDLLPFSVDKRLIESYIKGIRIYNPNLESYTFMNDKIMGIKVNRKYFDDFLVKKTINKGAILMENTYLKRIDTFNNKYEIKLSNGQYIISEFIIGADGVNSSVARLSNIRKRFQLKEMFVAQQCFSNIKPNNLSDFMWGKKDLLELHFNRTPMGYGWVFPLRNNLNIGIGGRAKEFIREKKKGKNHLIDFIHSIEKTRENKFKLKIQNVNGGLIPSGGFKRQIAKNNILLIGDAGGFVDPILGEGIRYAFLSAKLATKSICKVYDKNLKSAGEIYQKLCNKKITKNLREAKNYSFKIHNNLDLFSNLLKYLPEDLSIKDFVFVKSYKQMKKRILIKLLQNPKFLYGIIQIIYNYYLNRS